MQGVVPTPPMPNGHFQQPQYAQSGAAVPPASNVAPNPLLAALGNMPQQPQLAQFAQLQALAGIQPPAPYMNGQNGPQVSQAVPTLPFAPPATAGAQTLPVPLSANVTAPANATPLANMLAFTMNQAGTSNPNVQPAQIQMLQQLAPHMPPETLAGVIRALTSGNPQAAMQPPASLPIPPPPPFGPGLVAQQPQDGSSARPNLQESGRNEPEAQSKSRHRSRSPDFKRRRHSPPERRGSPTYGAYDPATANNGSSKSSEYDRRGRGKGRGYRNDRNDYRRSPPQAQRNRPISPQNMPRQKPVDQDSKLPNGHIKGDFFLKLGSVVTNIAQS
jgi:protein NRD1